MYCYVCMYVCRVPNDTDVAVVVTLLLQWLYHLPEPLLGYDHYDVSDAHVYSLCMYACEYLVHVLCISI